MNLFVAVPFPSCVHKKLKTAEKAATTSTLRNTGYKIKSFVQNKMVFSKNCNWLCVPLAAIFGLFTAYIDALGGDFHLFITALLLIFFGAILGFIQPQKAWRWALIIGGCVYAIFLLRRVFDELSLNFLKAVPTFIPAFFGAYAGVFLRKSGFKLKMPESV